MQHARAGRIADFINLFRCRVLEKADFAAERFLEATTLPTYNHLRSLGESSLYVLRVEYHTD
jgi:hypothetical protein